MAKIGRNDPCACGSGKKHKRCCLLAPAVANDTATAADGSSPTPFNKFCDCCIDRLNERADEVLDVLLSGRVDDAESLCHVFIRDFPGQAEGLDLLSMIFQERGHHERALDLLRQASHIAHANDDYDHETRSLMLQRINELELRA